MEFDMADVKPTVLSLFVVTVMAVIGITLLKWAMTKYPVPGLAEIILAV